ncbi:MAG TPA: amidohydrolase family protein [Stellaceae bacterium]|nr:amidohydrolase family protein [Stellaceae bacterium]
MRRLLIKSGTIVTMDRGVPDLPKGDLLIEDDRIAAVAPAIDAGDAEVIDAAGRIVMPGFVNAHQHTWQTALRGIAANWTILEYLHNMHAAVAPAFTPEDIHVSTLVGALNQLHSGTTTLVDWCHNNPTPAHTERAIDALQESGIRAVFLHGSPKPDPKPGQRHFSEIPHPRAEIERLARERLPSKDALVTLGMAVLGPAYSTYEVSRADLKLAREMGMLVSMHVGGGKMLVPDGFPRLLSEGLIDGHVNIVHGNSIDFETLKGLAGAGATVTVTPDIELQMGYGDCLTGPLRKLGARPTLGVDIESLIGGDMFTVTRVALQALRHADSLAIRRETGLGPTRVTVEAREALEWATINGAAMLGLEHRIGSLAPGKQADVVLLDADALNLFPVTDPVAAIVLHAGIANVETVLVAGRVMKRAGKLLYPDLARRKGQLAEASRRIVATVGGMH